MVYVDQASRLGYIHLQKTSDVEETVYRKRAFGAYMHSIGVQVRSYQADSGIFRANKWQEEYQLRQHRDSYLPELMPTIRTGTWKDEAWNSKIRQERC